MSSGVTDPSDPIRCGSSFSDNARPAMTAAPLATIWSGSISLGSGSSGNSSLSLGDVKPGHPPDQQELVEPVDSLRFAPSSTCRVN